MNNIPGAHFPQVFARLIHTLQVISKIVDVGEWHAMNVKGNPNLVSHELAMTSFEFLVPQSREDLADLILPNLPWADDHFQERVSRQPMNPAPSHEWWPYAMKGNAVHTDEQKQFSHTYPERYWPVYANVGGETNKGRQIFVPHVGIRYQYGDLDNVVHMLVRSPYSRQAYLPVWFPEDTGAVDNQRVPCSLGYQFLIRDGYMDIVYFLRSCDFVRHFQDDMYLTARLLQWMVREYNQESDPDVNPVVQAGRCIVHITSLHYFEGDTNKMKELADAHPQF